MSGGPSNDGLVTGTPDLGFDFDVLEIGSGLFIVVTWGNLTTLIPLPYRSNLMNFSFPFIIIMT